MKMVGKEILLGMLENLNGKFYKFKRLLMSIELVNKGHQFGYQNFGKSR